MKRTLLLILVFIAAVLAASCSSEGGAEEGCDYFTRPFSLTADFERQGLSGSFAFEYYPPEGGQLRFVSPDSLCGLKITREGETVREEFLGVSTEAEFEALERGHPLAALLRVFSALRSGSVEPKQTGEGQLYELADGSSLLAVSGVPRRIEVPSGEFTATVTSFEYLD
ncbi:MAG: hypothetical protein Q4B42_06980 [Oscillospiraceae bacterium]|nr:hypothetical protein [Oscillospiraceae bacterium]